MRYTLENCKLYGILSERKGISSDYCAILRLIEQPANELLAYIKKNYPSYTDHSIDHSFRILNYIYEIMNEYQINNITCTELFCLILSSFFHDMGMGRSDVPCMDKLRNEHGAYSEEPIRAFFKELKVINNIDRIVNCVAYVSRSHTRDIKEFYNDKTTLKIDKINGEEVRYGYLAILLRIGDLLDMEENRTCYMVQKVFPSYYNTPESINHHERHMEIITYSYNEKEINVDVRTHCRDNYKIWSNWFTYLRDEILWANTEYFPEYVNGGVLPKLTYNLKPVENANFSTEEIKFEIDDAGVLWKVISNSIYTGEYDYLRELLQNSIDACLLSCYVDESKNLGNAYVRDWPLDKYKVYVAYSQNQKQMYIYDNGIGMDIKSLRNYLFKTADSGYKHINSNRKFDFPAIAKFGIGFVACLTKADDIKIYSQYEYSDEEVMAEIEQGSSVAFIERLCKKQESGTFISLHLVNKFTFENIKVFLQDYFLCPSIMVTLINLDNFYYNMNIIENKELNHYEFEDLLQQTKMLKSKYDAFLVEKNYVSKINGNCMSIEDIISGLSGDDIFPIKKVKDYHESLLFDLKTLNIDNRLVDCLKKFNETKIEIEGEAYLELISKTKKQVLQYKEEISKEFSDYKDFYYIIGNNYKFRILDEEIVIIVINDDLQVSKVIKGIDIEVIKRDKGIIMINSNGGEKECGIEYDCVSTFLFDRGELVEAIAKIKTLESDGQKIGEKTDSFVDMDDLAYEIEERFENEIDEKIYKSNILDRIFTPYEYKIDALFCDGVVKIVKGVDPSYFVDDNVYMGSPFLQTCTYDKTWNYETVPVIGNSVFTQDGIKLGINLSSLIPLKANVFSCNLLGDARFQLNITRHDINNDRLLIEKWVNKYGTKIQNKVIHNITEKLNECGFVNFNWLKMLKNISTDYLSEYSYKVFKQTIKQEL